MTSLNSLREANVYAIPAGANFLDDLAQVLAAETNLKQNPDALADALIYVPNRRSERALAFALYRAAGHQALLLPTVRALGDLETADPPPSAEAAIADLPPLMSPATRLGTLTKLVMQFYESSDRPLPAVSCLAAARELARLLDQAALSGDVDWAALESLVPQADLAGHWQDSVKFLRIITEHWPNELEDAQKMDPYARRLAAAEAMAKAWQDAPPTSPVIIAGSTGATPASRVLMKAAMQLPEGLVVFPGLDLSLPPATLKQVRETPSHPQYAMARALAHLDLLPGDVHRWPGSTASAEQEDRRKLVHEALAPAQATADWTTRLSQISGDGDAARFAKNALNGLTLIDANDDSEEALIAAIMLRETLERPDETAALITPDAGLARRVSAMMKRWNVDVSPSAGMPLTQTPAGSLTLLVGQWMQDPADPVALMAMLQHPSIQYDTDAIRALDKHVLRGPRVWVDWPTLVVHAQALKADTGVRTRDFDGAVADRALDLLEALSAVLDQNKGGAGETHLGEDWYRQLSDTAGAVCLAPHPWSGEDGAALVRLLRDLADLAGPLGAQAPEVWLDLLQSEAAMQAIPTGNPHPKLAIWGPLEARLQSADHLILAGLNEGIWPEQPPADGFLPRVFRNQIGLADPDERIGLSAHDFAQLATSPRVTLLQSKRRDDKPAIASRWIWRLRTLVRGALGERADAALEPDPKADPRTWLTHIEAAPELPDTFTAEPRPKPPVSARPDKLSVTRIEQLVRDPYAIYCEHILNLKALDPLSLPPDVRVRGTAIHKALERFELEPNASSETLLNLVEQELRSGGEAEADLIALHDQRLKVCDDYLDWREALTHAQEDTPLTEERGAIELEIAGRRFTLTGTADRIERRVDNKIAILDFKTGKPPSEKQVRSGLSPQMPLQGLIAREGGYEKLSMGAVTALTYLRFGTQFEVQELGAAAQRGKLEAIPVEDLIASAQAGLIRLLTAFSDPEHPYLSAPRPERVNYESAYTRLARRAEWTGLSTYD